MKSGTRRHTVVAGMAQLESQMRLLAVSSSQVLQLASCFAMLVVRCTSCRLQALR